MSVTFAYTHPHSRMTWSGRGRKPRWVEEWLEAGHSLDELKPQAAKPATTGEPQAEREADRFDHLPLGNLVPSATNPRRSFPDASLAEMAESIRTHGVLHPILVRPWPGEGYGSQQYEIIAGERRFRAATLAGLDRLTLDLAAHPASLELELKRRALTRLKAGEFCMVPGWRASAYGMPMIHIGHALRRFEDRHEEAVPCHAIPCSASAGPEKGD